MKEYKCIICGSDEFTPLFKKGNTKLFHLYKCKKCSIEFIFPIPTDNDLDNCYNSTYFSNRTDRGYNNYFSPEIKKEIERVFRLNIKDLGFGKFAKTLNRPERSLDIGCAAGYFVNYMKSLNWEAHGIDVSLPCTDFAVDKLKLSVLNGSYLETEYKERFSLITMWATIEHLQHPELFIKKIYNDLEENGCLYISTCRSGVFNFKIFSGKKWRYYNFPEHIFFFRKKNIISLLKNNGFTVIKYKTYGSGINSKMKTLKKICDFLAKNFYTGDMMIISAKKIKREKS